MHDAAWAGGAVKDADHKSATKLAAQNAVATKPAGARALEVGVEYKEGGAFPQKDLGPVAAQLKTVLTGPLGLAEADVTTLDPEEHTKEGVTRCECVSVSSYFLYSIF